MHKGRITEDEIMSLLRAIELGQVTVEPDMVPEVVDTGDIVYRTDTGWILVVFNDANQWDYLTRVIANDGRICPLRELRTMPAVKRYKPSDLVAMERYQIPQRTRRKT